MQNWFRSHLLNTIKFIEFSEEIIYFYPIIFQVVTTSNAKINTVDWDLRNSHSGCVKDLKIVDISLNLCKCENIETESRRNSVNGRSTQQTTYQFKSLKLSGVTGNKMQCSKNGEKWILLLLPAERVSQDLAKKRKKLTSVFKNLLKRTNRLLQHSMTDVGIN